MHKKSSHINNMHTNNSHKNHYSNNFKIFCMDKSISTKQNIQSMHVYPNYYKKI